MAPQRAGRSPRAARRRCPRARRTRTASATSTARTGGTVANTIAGVGATTAGTFESNSIGLEPGFRDLAAGDYSPAAKSPCRNTGTWTYWGATKAEARTFSDLAGRPRFVGIAIDIGCYENQAGDATRLILQ